MTETDLSNRVKKALELQCLLAFRQRINYDYMRLESHLTLQGLPDANLCVSKYDAGLTIPYPVEIWLEYKIGNNDPSPLQIAWARRRFDLGQTNVYCVRGYSEATSLVHFQSMNHFWTNIPDYWNITYDELAYRLLTGEFYDKGRCA